MDCIFCKIVEGSIPSKKIFENGSVIGFHDLHPQATKHYLFIHKKHTKDIVEMASADPQQIQDVILAIAEFGKASELVSDGMRVVTNLGKHAGQTVFHTHFHVLGGEQLGHFGR